MYHILTIKERVLSFQILISAFIKGGLVDKIMDGSSISSVHPEPEGAQKGYMKNQDTLSRQMLNCHNAHKCLGQMSTNLELCKEVRIVCYCYLLGQDDEVSALSIR